MKKIILISMLMLSACATTAQNRTARLDKISLQLPKSSKGVAAAVVSEMQTNGYRLQAMDKDLGIITFAPKDHLIKRGALGVAWPIRINLQVTIIKNMMNAIVTYECQYGQMLSGNTQWAGCYSGDSDFDPQANSLKAEIELSLKKAAEM